MGLKKELQKAQDWLKSSQVYFSRKMLSNLKSMLVGNLGLGELYERKKEKVIIVRNAK